MKLSKAVVAAIMLLLLLGLTSPVSGKSIVSDYSSLPEIIPDLRGGDTIAIPASSSQPSCLLILEDATGDGRLELKQETPDGEVRWWNMDGSPCLRAGQATRLLRGTESVPASESKTPGVPELQPGWPVGLGGAVKSSVLFADVIGDEALEVFVGADDSSMHGFDVYGNDLPGWPQNTGGQILSSPAAGDIDGDGKLEVVVGCWDWNVYAWNGDGSTINGGWPKQTDGIVTWASPALGDIDSDGILEVVIVSYWNGSTVYALNGDGSDVPGWPVHLDNHVESTPSLADIDKDGRLEIIVATHAEGGPGGTVEAFNGEDGTRVEGWPVDIALGSSLASPVVADVDDDGELEIIVGTSYWGGSVYVINSDGTVANGWPKDVGNNVTAAGLAVDLDKDGDLEIIVGTTIYLGTVFPGRVFAWEYDGQSLPGWPLSLDGEGERVTAGVLSSDVNSDGVVELIVGTSQSTNANEPAVYAFEADGSLLNEYWPLWLKDAVSTPAIADIDLDGQLELAVGSRDDSLLYCWQLGEGTYPAEMPWPMFQHDRQHSGWYCEVVCGNADGAGPVNISDVVYLISFIFGNGPHPVPLTSADVDCNSLVNISDAVYLISYIFGGGAAPCAECD